MGQDRSWIVLDLMAVYPYYTLVKNRRHIFALAPAPILVTMTGCLVPDPRGQAASHDQSVTSTLQQTTTAPDRPNTAVLESRASTEAPQLAGRVASRTLPIVSDRLPENLLAFSRPMGESIGPNLAESWTCLDKGACRGLQTPQGCSLVRWTPHDG